MSSLDTRNLLNYNIYSTSFCSVGDLCIYEEGDIGVSGAILGSCSMDFGDYFGSLVQKEPCDGKNPGTLQWTPDDSTPDLLYYQVRNGNGNANPTQRSHYYQIWLKVMCHMLVLYLYVRWQ